MSAFSAAFLAGDERALALLPDEFRHASRRAEAVRRASSRAIAAPVVDALRAQASRWAMSAARRASLDALSQPGTVAVVTGQQVGLFLGPLYSFYKAASAVVTARALEKETGVRCVPVFWLQTEDHDLEEIDHLDVRLADGSLQRIALKSAHTPRASVSAVRLGDDVDVALRALADALDESPHADEVLALFRKRYRSDATWSDAFAGVLSELLPELVLLDPSDEALVAHVHGVHQRAFDECDAIAKVLQERQRALESACFDVQVHVREASPLSFVHPDGRDGPRFRVERCPAGWRVVGTERVVEASHFSTSALLRPITQDTLLPTAAIIGGPGELNYFAQLPPLYAHFGLPMPMVMPRARFRVVDPRSASLLKKLKLSPEDAEAAFETVMQRVAPVSPELTPELLERRLLDAVGPVLDTVPQLEGAVKRTRATMARAASRLAGRYAAALQTRDETLVSQVRRLQSALYPHDEPQERVLGFPAFAAKFGIARFSTMVLESVTPFSTAVQTLWPLVPAGVAEAS